MGRRRRTSGKSYQVLEQTKYSAKINGVYLCPYCGKDSQTEFLLESINTDAAMQRGFFQTLECTHCQRVAIIKFCAEHREE